MLSNVSFVISNERPIWVFLLLILHIFLLQLILMLIGAVSRTRAVPHPVTVFFSDLYLSHGLPSDKTLRRAPVQRPNIEL